MIWELEDGINLVRAVQAGSRMFGYHVTIGGSVINKGRSEKDVDLYFLPFEQTKDRARNPDGLLNWLISMWGPGDPLGASGMEAAQAVQFEEYYDEETNMYKMRQVGVAPSPSVFAHKVKFIREAGDRIDVFIL